MKQKLIGIMLSLGIVFQVFAQKPTDPITFDKETRLGKLPNGLTYYIRKNAKPEHKAELRLVVNAGSVLERDDQQGVAHFLEHMAFNGTKNFPKNELLSYLQKAGVRFGADLNATTSTDFTMYMLPIPTTDASILKNGYQVLRDWAGNLLLEQEEIDKERGIILEEKRMRQNAGMRTYAQYLPVMTNNSKYGSRIPIGKEEIIKTASRKAFADYYADWYRPNNMAVIIVGDIDVNESENTIKQLFGDLTNPTNAPERPVVIPINWHNKNTAMVVTDAENTNNILSVYIGLWRDTENKKWSNYGEGTLAEVVSALFGARMQESSVNPKSPFTYAGVNTNASFLRGYRTLSLFAAIKEDAATAMNVIMAEIIKAKQFGFTQAELDRVKINLLKRYEEALLEKDKTESSSYVSEYVEHFLNKEPSPGIVAEQKFVAAYLKALTLEQVNAYIKKCDIDKPAFILLNAKESMKGSISNEVLTQVFEKAKQQKVEAYIEKATSGKLMEKEPASGKIIGTTKNQESGYTTFKLSNGISVAYKKTDFKNDEIQLRGSQWGGATVLTPEEIKIAKYLSLTANMGLGSHKAVDMPKLMTGTMAYVNTTVSPNMVYVNGMCRANDFEKLLQILYLRATQVNFEVEDFEGIKSNYIANISGMAKNPNFKFMNELNKYKFSNSNRIAGLPTAEEANDIKIEDLKSTYQKIFSNLNGMTLVFVGNIDETNLNSLVEKYIASIPTQPQPIQLNKANLIPAIQGKNNFSIKAGKENKSEINYSYYGKIQQTDAKEVQAFQLMSEILQMNATQKLREEMGSTYSPRVSPTIFRQPIADYSISLNVSSLPENVDKIIAAFDELILQMVNGQVSDEDLQKAKAQRIKSTESLYKNNSYWVNVIEQSIAFNYKIIIEDEFNNLVNSVSKEDIVAVAKKYLANCNILKGVMNPE